PPVLRLGLILLQPPPAASRADFLALARAWLLSVDDQQRHLVLLRAGPAPGTARTLHWRCHPVYSRRHIYGRRGPVAAPAAGRSQNCLRRHQLLHGAGLVALSLCLCRFP